MSLQFSILGLILLSCLIVITQLIIAYRSLQEVHHRLVSLIIAKSKLSDKNPSYIDDVSAYDALIQLNYEYFDATCATFWSKIIIRLSSKYLYEIPST
ncbi:MAG TPA: hypothetical protein PKG71_01115 [Candidatus Woesebacteria bacterium]|nr:hypothetical protein [Candidatus Woesebacteria bacterium]HNS94546.1 hypothetical protein [Candidatus Woesebacteria bacterium]